MKMKIVALPILLAFTAHGASLLTLTNPVADDAINTTASNNDRSDWVGTTAFPVDPDEANTTDFSLITIAHSSTNLYIRQQLYRTNNSGFFSGSQIMLFDTDQSATTGYRGPSGTYAIGAEYLLEGTSLYSFGGAAQTDFTFSFLGSVTFDDFPINDHELSFAQSLIGSPTSFDFIATSDYFGGGDLYPDTSNGGDTGGFYTYSTVPEPGSVFLGCAGLFALLTRRNRNR